MNLLELIQVTILKTQQIFIKNKDIYPKKILISLNFLKLNQYILQIKNLYKFRENLSKNEVDRTHDS